MHRRNRLGQEFPGWFVILGIIITVLGLVFLIWLAVKSGKTGTEIITQIP